MKICFDAKRAFCNTRGLGNYSRDTIRLVSQFFPDNDYFLFTPKKDNKVKFEPPINSKVILPESFFAKKFKSFWRTYSLSKLSENFKADVFHGLSNEIPSNIEKTSVKSVISMHDLIFLRFPEQFPAFDRYFYKKKCYSSCNRADAVIAISENTKNDLIEFNVCDQSKIHVVYQGCNPIFAKDISDIQLDNVRKKYSLPQQFILSVGAIERRKNHIAVIQAIKNGNIDIPYIIAGRKTDYLSVLEQEILKLGLNNKVKFLFDVPLNDLPAIYHLSSLVVYVSLFEGFGIPIIEAMNCKVPVITSLGSCFSETGGDAVVYCDPNNIEQISHSILELLSDTDKRNELINKGLIHKEKFSDYTVANNLMNIYKSIL
ncbi:MAG: glycosyltransferase family 4 protein [Bacteroidales bacterium]|nr:glycosyltransferase family 4 protein [Bacteroidales bacterium]